MQNAATWQSPDPQPDTTLTQTTTAVMVLLLWYLTVCVFISFHAIYCEGFENFGIVCVRDSPAQQHRGCHKDALLLIESGTDSISAFVSLSAERFKTTEHYNICSCANEQNNTQ